jgi:hypothetical protein
VTILGDKAFLVALNPLLLDIINKNLSRKQKYYLRNKHKLSDTKKEEVGILIKGEISAKATREKAKKLLRRTNKRRP